MSLYAVSYFSSVRPLTGNRRSLKSVGFVYSEVEANTISEALEKVIKLEKYAKCANRVFIKVVDWRVLRRLAGGRVVVTPSESLTDETVNPESAKSAADVPVLLKAFSNT